MGYLYSLPIYIQYSCLLFECWLFQQQNKILQKSAFVKRMRELGRVQRIAKKDDKFRWNHWVSMNCILKPTWIMFHFHFIVGHEVSEANLKREIEVQTFFWTGLLLRNLDMMKDYHEGIIEALTFKHRYESFFLWISFIDIRN